MPTHAETTATHMNASVRRARLRFLGDLLELGRLIKGGLSAREGAASMSSSESSIPSGLFTSGWCKMGSEAMAGVQGC